MFLLNYLSNIITRRPGTSWRSH